MEYDRSPSQRSGALANSAPTADRGAVATPVTTARLSSAPATMTSEGRPVSSWWATTGRSTSAGSEARARSRTTLGNQACARTSAIRHPARTGSAFVSVPKYSRGSYFTSRLRPR
jgi:hypothetical protein